MTDAEVEEAQKIKTLAVLSSKTKSVLESTENKEIRNYMRELNSHTIQTLNCGWLFSKSMIEEQKAELFGTAKMPFESEACTVLKQV